MEDDEFDLDALLEDRQDLSQYSYDPEDRLETVTFPDSQQSSQASDKTDVFFGVLDDEKPADDLEVDPVLASDHPCPTAVPELLAVSSSQQDSLALELEDSIEVFYKIVLMDVKKHRILDILTLDIRLG